jgi:hypothetical protein
MPLLICDPEFHQFWHTHTIACFIPKAGARHCTKIRMKRAISTLHGKDGGYLPNHNVPLVAPWRMISGLPWPNPAILITAKSEPNDCLDGKHELTPACGVIRDIASVAANFVSGTGDTM